MNNQDTRNKFNLNPFKHGIKEKISLSENDPSYHKISIVTPNLNGGKFLEETILSVLEQNYPNLEYIMIDGGSTDNSVTIIHKYSKYFAYWESTSDHGLYYALQKGFEKSTGEIMGWINSDDILHKKSLFIIAEIFSSSKDIQWIQGYPTVIDETGRMIYHRDPVNSKYFFYLKEYQGEGKFIQQESTFWTRRLWVKAGGYLSTEYKYAGDFELWMRFFHQEYLYTTEAILGSFRTRPSGQISKMNYQDYLNECDRIIDHHYELLSESDKRLIHKVQQFRNFNKRIPRFCSMCKVNYFENKISGSKPTLKFDFGENKFPLTS